MSWSSWDANGYGVAEEDIVISYSEEDVDRLLKKAPAAYKAIREKMKADEVDTYEDYETEFGKYGIVPVIVAAIREIQGISLEYHPGEDGNFVLFPPFYPWDACLEHDKDMTTDRLDAIYRKYFGADGDYVSAQYQG